MRFRKLIGLGSLAGLAMVALFGLTPAQAHNAFVSSNPAEGSVVTEQVGTFAVTTSDLLLDSGTDSPTTYIQVRGPGDSALYYGDGCATVDGATVTMPAQLGAAGDYTVLWGVVSADGHPITGEFGFTWAPADGQELGEGFAAAPTCGVAPPASESPAPETAAPVTPTDSATTAPSASSSPAASADDASASAADILWIGAAVGVLVIAAIVVLVVVRSRAGTSIPAESSDVDAAEGDHSPDAR
ncbi:MAG: copper resistance CopC family protein [Mycetocola sp.]